MTDHEQKPKSFAEAGNEQQVSLAREVFDMLRQNKKWWLLPILVILGLFGLLLIAGSTGAAPFIYTLF